MFILSQKLDLEIENSQLENQNLNQKNCFQIQNLVWNLNSKFGFKFKFKVKIWIKTVDWFWGTLVIKFDSTSKF